MQWIRKLIYGRRDAQNAQAEMLASLVRQLEDCTTELRELRAELFDVPELPAVRFLANPLEDRLRIATRETTEYLDELDEVSSDERRYLLMQMFFRGSAELIRSQLSSVLETLDIPDDVRARPVLDVGCGRGELLNMLDRRGYHAIGIDSSELMVKKLNEQSLQALHGDAIERLNQFSNDSLCGITAFHVIEHVKSDYLQALLAAAYEKIAPGGFILLETPNPFCFEALSFFYTDDTHCRPIQPFQLAFLVESAGFTKTRAHFSAPVPAGRKQALHTWMRLYQNHGILAYKPPTVVSQQKHVA